MYDGTAFSGWQSQPDRNAIQDYIEARIFAIFGKQIRIHGSGRTDAGVHARGQIFHFDADWSHGPDALLRAFRSGLPEGIQIIEVKPVDSDFHARFSVQKKRYIYSIYLGRADPFNCRYKWSIGEKNIDLNAMNHIAKKLIGYFDFSAFGASRGDSSVGDPWKTLFLLSWSLRGRDLTLETEGTGYLYKMVRTLTATLLSVGLGQISEQYVLDCFQSGVRREKIVTAPARGLVLDKVFY